jgi:hypothetical protein
MQRLGSQRDEKQRRPERFHLTPLFIPQHRIGFLEAGDKTQHHPPAHEFMRLNQVSPVSSIAASRRVSARSPTYLMVMILS